VGGAVGAGVGYGIGAGVHGLVHWVENRGHSPVKPPHDATDPNGAKAPGKPGDAEGFVDPKGGPKWVANPYPGRGGSSHGWVDAKGRVWCPTGQGGRAHAGSHWDVQFPDGSHKNVWRGQNIDNVPFS
jgi:hypothetical protein